jgi:hypothetical protein
MLGDAVVENALAFDHVVFLRVEGGRIVLEVLHQRARFGAFIEDFCLALVDAAALFHMVAFCCSDRGRSRGPAGRMNYRPGLSETVRQNKWPLVASTGNRAPSAMRRSAG